MSRLLRLFVVLTTFVIGLPALEAGEKRIDRSALPSAVQKTVDVEVQGATIRDISRETKGKEIFYEVELVENSRNKDILIDRNGQVVEVEEEVPFESLPAAIQRRLRAETGDARIENIEALTKRGKLAGYEIHLMKNGARSEIGLSPEGQRLKH